VSPGFLASAYCNGIELKRALERHERGEARVIPVLLKPVDWEGEHHHSLSRLQPLAAPGRSGSGQRPAPIGQPIHERAPIPGASQLRSGRRLQNRHGGATSVENCMRWHRHNAAQY
ncbi:MAG: hypothetical protein VKO39_10135, partial [Cyanobacteriota bacterium]|nr:hypothetical protein [Cyanobacteriota bacterium]